MKINRKREVIMAKKREKSFWSWAVLVIAVLAAVVLHMQSPVQEEEQETNSPLSSSEVLNVYYLDVGQGDSELIELPNGQNMLIDAGNPENGSDINQFLKEQEIEKIDYLVATHPHADHIGGMAEVINAVEIGSVYMPKVSTTSKTFENLLSTISQEGLSIKTAKAGVELFHLDNLKAVMVAPVGTNYSDLNQYSAVIKLTYENTSFLFTGDAGEESEKEITADVSADVLKVGHHGSDTSSTQSFLNRVSPKYAVIEVGKDNKYGHPASTTLKKLEKMGTKIYRTDEDGTILIQSDGTNITVKTHIPDMNGQDETMKSAA
jgi:competence protein ComEC